MWNDMQRLRDDPHLLRLLEHYVQNTADDREAWLDRVMLLNEADAKRLHELHGLLIAFGWLEQNSGQVPVVKAAACPHCYRTTAAGRRALKQTTATDDDADNVGVAA